MYSNLPRSLKQECLVRAKVEANEDVLKERQKIVETTTPSDLAKFKSVSDIPIPSALENIFKTPEKKSQEDPEIIDDSSNHKRKYGFIYYCIKSQNI